MSGDSSARDAASAGGSASLLTADALTDWGKRKRSNGLPTVAEMKAEDELYKAQCAAGREALRCCMDRFNAHVRKLEKWIERKDKEDEAHRNNLKRMAALISDSSLSPEVRELLCSESSDGDSDVGSLLDLDSGCSSTGSDSVLSDQEETETEHPSSPTPLPLHCSEDPPVLLNELPDECDALANQGEMQLRALSAPPGLQPDYEDIAADHGRPGRITDGGQDDEDEDDPDESTDMESTMKDPSQPPAAGLPRISVEAAAQTLSETGVPLLQYSANAVVQAGREESKPEDVWAGNGAGKGRPGWCPLGCPGCRLVARPRPLSMEEEVDIRDPSNRLYYYCTLCWRPYSCSHRALRHTLGHSNFLPVTGMQRCKCGADILSVVQLHSHAVHHIMACAYSCSSCHSAAAPGPWAFLEEVRGSPWRCAGCSNKTKGPASHPQPLVKIQVHEPPPHAPEPLDTGVSPVLRALGLTPGPSPVGKEHSYSRKGQQARANLNKSQAQALPQQKPVQKRGRKPRAPAAPRDKKAAERKADNSERACNAASTSRAVSRPVHFGRPEGETASVAPPTGRARRDSRSMQHAPATCASRPEKTAHQTKKNHTGTRQEPSKQPKCRRRSRCGDRRINFSGSEAQLQGEA